MTGHATSAASPTCSRVWVGVHKIQTRSRRHICLVSSTKLRCFCVSSLSLVTFICVRLNLANINSGHLYMVGGCLQNITSLLLSCCVSERQDRMSRSSTQKGSISSRVSPSSIENSVKTWKYQAYPEACSPSAAACCLGSSEAGLNPTPRLLPIPAMCNRSLG